MGNSRAMAKDIFSLPPGTTMTTRMLHDAYQAAKMIEDSENGTFPREVDCRGTPRCNHCNNFPSSMFNPLVCSGCRALVYCSPKCQLVDWKKGDPPHRYWCAQAKEYMKRHPYFLSQIKQFPWARIEGDGSFSHRIYEARLGVYGAGIQFGYWSVPALPDSHDSEELPHPKDYIHGEMMLKTQWPTHIDAWKLGHMNAKGDIIPRLSFTTEFPPPPKVEPGQIKDWQSWYTWRRLSMASPAALLMHYPLSVYHLLVDTLQIAKCKDVSAERRALQIHYIGAEKELNHLPLFSELALLLPSTDITFIVFGKPAFDLVTKAHKSHSGSLATKETVWSYTAPESTGSSSIEIKLYSKSEYWTADVLKELKPDALIGLNAGLATYDPWEGPVSASIAHDIPFASTDYNEQSCQKAAIVALGLLHETCVVGGPQLTSIQKVYCSTSDVVPNPFHMPGQKQTGSLKMPSLSNGFITSILRADGGSLEE